MVLVGAVAYAATGRYSPGDWTSWTAMREIRDVAEYQQIIYVATEGGIGRYSEVEERWVSPLTTSDGLIDRNVYRIRIDRSTADLIYHTPSGRAVYSLREDRPNTWRTLGPTDLSRPRHGPHGSQRQVRLPDPDRLPQAGMERLRPVPGNRRSEQELFDVINRNRGVLPHARLCWYREADAAIDAWDTRWLAWFDGDRGAAPQDAARLRLLSFGLLSEDARATSRYGDNIWFAGRGGVTVHHRDLDAWATFEPNDGDFALPEDVRDVLAESTDVWLGTSRGLVHYDSNSGRWEILGTTGGLPDESVLCLAADSSSVWIGTEHGVSRFDRAGRRAVTFSDDLFPEENATDLAVSPDGAVWAATRNGLYRSRNRGRSWEPLGRSEPILDGNVTVVEAFGDTIWCASAEGIIAYDTRGGVLERRPVEEYQLLASGHGSLTPLSLAAGPRGLLWVGTPGGVLRCDRRANVWRRFTTFDGLIDDRVLDIEMDEDYIWFATPAGVTRFYWGNPHRVD